MYGGSFSSRLILVAALGLVRPLAGQSTHLAELERKAPAISVESAGAVAVGGWASAWLAPAAGGRATGVLIGVEHNGFAAVTSMMAAARFRLGPMWQLTVAQTSVKDLFDATLLDQYPGLAQLGASATQLGADVIFGPGMFSVSLGWRYERDELLGDAASAWLARGSAAARLPLGFRLSLSAERAMSTAGMPAGTGRAAMGVARHIRANRFSLAWGAGVIADDAWSRGRGRRVIATSVRSTLADLVSFSVAVGTERDPFASDGWLGFLAFGLGLNVGTWSADFRHGGPGTTQAAPTAMSLLWAPEQ